MANELTHTEPLLYRMLKALGLRESTGATVASDHVAGADFAVGSPASRGFAAVDSLSTVAVFPFVAAAMNAIATDTSALPLRVSIGTGADAELVDDHPVLSLIARPSSRVSSSHWRRQIIQDLTLCGDAYCLIRGEREPEVLLRLHPERVKVIPLPDGQVSHFEYSGAGQSVRYEWDEVLHFRQTSWEDDPKGLYGNGAIRALAADLTTDKLASDLASASAKTGRPTTVFSPLDPQERWTESQIRIMRSVFERQMKGTGGALFLGSGAKLDTVSFSPRDLEYSKVREGVRESILAVFDVPPTRLGGNSANYATSREQATRYFEGLRGRVRVIDDELSRLARMFPGWEDTDVRVYHDFSSVDALTESRDARVNRVLTWSTLGLELNDAAAYEGFNDLPSRDVDEEAGEGADVGAAPAGQPMAATALNGAQVASLLAIVGQVSLGTLSADAAVALIVAAFPTVSEAQARRIVGGALAAPAPTPAPAQADTERSSPYPMITREARPAVTEAAREEVWRGFIKRVHDPVSDSYEKTMKKYLRGAGARAAKRLKEELGKRSTPPLKTRAEGDAVDPDLLKRVLDEMREAEILRRAMAKPMREAFATAVKAAITDFPDEWDIALSPARIDAAVDANLGKLVKDLRTGTANAVRDVITTGISEGSTVAEMQKAIMDSRGYAPSRAAKIATTETTASVNAGTLKAYEAVAEAGFEMRYEWLSAKDSVVRDEHEWLDRNHPPIEVGDVFKVGDHEAPAPGQFGSVGMNVNCRCTLLPVIDED